MIRTIWDTLKQIARNLLFPRSSRLEEKLAATRRELARSAAELEWELNVGASLVRLYQPLISSSLSIREMAGLVLDEACRLTGGSEGYVAAREKGRGLKVICATAPRKAESGAPRHVSGPSPLEPGDGGLFPGLRGYSLNTGEPFFTNAARQHAAFRKSPAWHFEIRRFLAVPILLEGRAAGQIAVANPPSDFTARDLKAIDRLADVYALALRRKTAEEQTRSALREKEILLREIHHRVKNNLQVISSLLGLQAGQLGDSGITEILLESQNRVRSMAMVHDQLHRSRDLSRINFAEYIRSLTASLIASYGVRSSRISTRLQVQEACLSIDLAVPCGLIVQELVSNCLKHAFPSGRSGEVRIALETEGASGRWRLTVADNGCGLPEEIDIGGCTSLGLRLVRILVDQIDGELECIPGNGTEFRIQFRTN